MNGSTSRDEVARPAVDFAASLRGFGPLGLLAMAGILFTGNVFVPGTMFVVPIGAILVLVWTHWSRTPWREIGYSRPGSWMASLLIGVAFGTALKLMMKAVVMPLLGADPINQAYHFLVGNRAMLPSAVYAMFVAGFGEETVFRGYLFERFRKLFGCGVVSSAAIVLITSAWFGLAHYAGQGLDGVRQATVVGLVFGGIYARTGRLWMLMWAHTAFDLTALAIIYWDLEAAVAHLFFK